MKPLRLAAVRYLNTAPLIEGLEKAAGVVLELAVPAAIGGMVAAGRVDMGLASVVDAASCRPGLALVPAGMIGCDGPTLTVRLFSRVHPGEITRLHADPESHTSVALARVVLARRFGVSPQVAAFAGADWGPGSPESLLLIGDKVVTRAPPLDDYPFRLDLGEEWKALTGLPFVYAMWMCRAGAAEEPRIAAGAALLDRQRRRNLARLDWIVERHAPSHGWAIGEARRYIGSLLRYEVGERERGAVERFFGECSDLGLLPRVAVPWARLLEPAA